MSSVGGHNKFVSDDLKQVMKEAVLDLYKFELDDAKERYNTILMKVEEEKGPGSIVAIKLTRKFMFDLKNYVSYEDAKWFIMERMDRVQNDEFGNLVILQHLYVMDKDFENGNAVNSQILELANNEGNAIKQLLGTALVASGYYDQGDKLRSEAMLESIDDLSECIEIIIENKELTIEGSFYLVSAYDNLSFLFRNLGLYVKASEYLRRALDINDNFGKDLAVALSLDTSLFRRLRFSIREKHQLRFEMVLKAIERATTEDFIVMYGPKVLREAFIELSLTAVETKFRKMNKVHYTGKRMLELLRNMLGEQHHEVVFTASQMALNSYADSSKEYLEFFLNIVLDNTDKIGETSRIQVITKARTCSNLSELLKRLKRLEEAEFYSRYDLELNIKVYGNTHQYVSQAMRKLAFILSAIGKKAEGLALMKECLDVSLKSSPDFTKYHDKVRKYILDGF